MIYIKISLHCCQKSSSFLQTSSKLYLVDQDQRAQFVIFYLSARITSTQAEVKAPLQPHIHRCIISCFALSSAKFAKSTIYQNSGCSMKFSCQVPHPPLDNTGQVCNLKGLKQIISPTWIAETSTESSARIRCMDRPQCLSLFRQ